MNPWLAKGLFLAATVVMIAIRAPHGQRSRSVKVKTNRKGTVEKTVLTFAWVSFFVPLVWVATRWLSFADYRLRLVPLALGAGLYATGLWLFQRSHADLGTNWSITLQVREQHRLITHGVYRRIRHPMYLALLLYALGQAFAIPNWIAGPSYLAVMVPLMLLRLRPEEQMMVDEFGQEYEDYRRRTKRLIPRIW
jgi:protein-S-isoprenylcysteine O-methyltransferase Ste14